MLDESERNSLSVYINLDVSGEEIFLLQINKGLSLSTEYVLRVLSFLPKDGERKNSE